MKRIDISEKQIFPSASLVASVGFFDGVHAGHQFLIDQVKSEAKRVGLPPAVITFPVHPRQVLQKDYQPALLCGYEEKLERLARTGIDYCISLPFTPALSQLSARDFIHQVLKSQLGVQTLLVGYDHKFGCNRKDDFSDYERYGNESGVSVLPASELKIKGENVSSSKIRCLLEVGDIKSANALLTYNYTISGEIVEGYQVGRTLGFPTANIRTWERYKVMPPSGVYAVLVHIETRVHKGMLYIGKRPTLNLNSEVSIEVNIFDFDANLYNQSITVEFIDFVRGNVKFDTIEQLKEQIHKDKEIVKQRLSKIEQLTIC